MRIGIGSFCLFSLLCLADHVEGSDKGWKYLDLLFVIDGKFTGPDNAWNYGKQFLQEIVRNSSGAIDSGSTRVGVMQYNYFVSMPIRMRGDLTRRVTKQMDSLEPRYMYFARLGQTLHKAEMVMDHHRLRKAPQLIVIISHSQSIDQFHTQLTSIREQHIKTIFIDVGELYLTTDLKKFVHHYLPVKDYNQIMNILADVTTLVHKYSDLDECKLRLHNCDAHATCTNKKRGFKCTCKLGWYGNGTICWRHHSCDEIVASHARVKNNKHNSKHRVTVNDDKRAVTTETEVNDATVKSSWELENDLDIIFAIGLSESLGQQNFQTAKKLIMRATQNLISKPSDHTVQLGIATFTYLARLKVPLRNWEISMLQPRVKALQYRPGYILAEMALTKVNGIITRQARHGAQKVIVMVLSGQTLGRIYHGITSVQTNNTKVILVCIENRSRWKNSAADEQFQDVIFMDSLSDMSNIVNKIANKATTHDDLL